MTSPLQVIQIPFQPDFIDFSNGEPALSLLPIHLLQEAAKLCLAENDPAILQYGAEQGNGYFRRALAEFLTHGYGFPVDPASLFVTNGSSMGLHLACSIFTSPGDVVFVEEPTYFLALHIFADHGLIVVPLPTDRDGLVIESLEQALKQHHPKLVYIIPTFQNPSGQTLAADRRKKLAQLSREHDFIVAADEVYHFLNYSCPTPEPMAVFLGEGNILSINSFSKILAPGLRLGWIQTSAELIRRFTDCGLLDSGGGLNPFSSAIVRFVIETGGLAANIEGLKKEYGARVKAMDGSIHKYLPQAEFLPPEGGYFFWLRLPGVDSAVLREMARPYKVGFHPGIRFSGRGGLSEYIRLSYVNYTVPEIEEGLRRLGQIIAETSHS